MMQTMNVVAVYNLKGGVGKTTLAVNLAWSAATLSSRHTLLWDLDPQGGATFLLGSSPTAEKARSVFAKDIEPSRLITPTGIDRLSVLPADRSLRSLDHLLFSLGKRKRLAKLLEGLSTSFDRIILDCPPGLTETSEQVMRSADVILIPVIPSPLSRRAFDDAVEHLHQHHAGQAAILPVFSMADRRRALHKAALDAQPDWPVIPMASVIEQMAARRKPVGAFASSTVAAESFSFLWRAVERKLAGHKP